MFWVNVPVGIFGTLWAYWRLREVGTRSGGRIDWWGNITFAVGPGLHPGRRHHRDSALPRPRHGLDEPRGAGAALRRPGPARPRSSSSRRNVAEPMFRLSLFRIRAFAAGNVAAFAARLGQGGLQFMLVIWLQGIWLPLHGYNYSAHAVVGRHLPAAAHRRLPRLRTAVGPLVGPLRRPRLRHDRHGRLRRQLHRPAAPPGRTSATAPSPCSSPSTASASACSARPTRRR